MAKEEQSLSLGGAFLKLAVIVGAFVGGIVMTRVVNDMFTEAVGRKDWYPFSGPYNIIKDVGPKGPLVQ